MSFTPEEITEILQAYFESIAHRQYTGSRYVPIFGRVGESSCDWDNSGSYEPLTIVLHEGNSYTSRQFVPAGAAITNTDYWVLTGNFNAQVESYRREVVTLAAMLPDTDFDAVNTVKKYVDDTATGLAGDISNEETARIYQDSLRVVGFANVAVMKASEDIAAGMICHTDGFHASGDGGAAYYEIRATGTANEMDVIACGELYAHLINETNINVRSYGAKGNATDDDTAIIQYCVNKAIGSGQSQGTISKVYFPAGRYKITDTITIPSSTLNSSTWSNIEICGNNQRATYIESHIDDLTKSVFYVTASSKIAFKNFSIMGKNNQGSNGNGITTDGYSMMIDIANLFIFNMNIAFNMTNCVSTIRNCFANSCNCGFRIFGVGTSVGTGNTLISCYASQNTKQTEDIYAGCGYCIGSNYTNLLSCASDSNPIGYKITGGYGITLQSCGTERCGNDLYVNDIANNVATNVLIDNCSFAGHSQPYSVIIESITGIVNFANMNIDIASGFIENDADKFTHLNFDNVQLRISNSSLYSSKSAKLPIYNSWNKYKKSTDGYLRKRECCLEISSTTGMQVRLPKKSSNGKNESLFLNFKTLKGLSWTLEAINENISFHAYCSGTTVYLGKGYSYDSNVFEITKTSDDDYDYYDIVPQTTESIAFLVNVELVSKDGNELFAIKTIDYE